MSQSDKSLALRAWSESVAKNFELFREATEMMVRDHQKSNVKSSSFAIHLHHMSARETSVPIKHSLETLSHRIDAVETERLKVLAQLQALIVNKIGKYQTEIKVQNMNISKRNVQVSEYARADKELASARASGNQTKISQATGHLHVAEQHMRSSEDVLNKGLGDFEHHRVMEMKEFLRRYVRNQIYFHAKSIEGLTAAYGEIVKIDPDTEKAIFLRRIRDLEYQNKGNPQMRQDQQQAQAQAQQQAADVAAGRPQQLQQQQPQPLMSPQNFGR